MIEVIKEKSYTTKDQKLQLFKHSILFDKFRLAKISCSVVSSKQVSHELYIYFGFSNGNIVGLTLPKHKSLYYKYEEFFLLKCRDEFLHRGPVFTLISEIIDGVSVLFSGGVDGSIKLWSTDVDFKEKNANNLIKTILAHKGTVIALAFSKSRSVLVSSSSDMTMKIWKLKESFDKIMNPFFECISTIRSFDIRLNKDRDLPYWITTLSLKESDIIELYAGDTKGRVLTYNFVDDTYVKFTSNEAKNRPTPNLHFVDKKYMLNTFNYSKGVNLHKRWSTIKVVHSIYDSIIFSLGFDNCLTSYNVKTNKIIFEIANSNNKSHFSALYINFTSQEIFLGDDQGVLTIIKIFNKTETRIKILHSRIIFIHGLEIFSDQEHILIGTEESFEIYKISRKAKINNLKCHDGEIIKLFVTEPIKIGSKIIEDAKVISAAYDNKIKIWDFLTMECMNTIPGPELSRRNVDISTICYLANSLLIAVGTDIGKIFFWDLNRSQYVKSEYEKFYTHKSYINSIITFYSSKIMKEYTISCGSDGLILIWEIEKIEIKIKKRKDEFVMPTKPNTKRLKDKEKLPYLNTNSSTPEDSNNFVYMPQVKLCINTVTINQENFKINAIAYSLDNKPEYIYSAGDDCNINIWTFNKGNHVATLQGHKSPILCLTFDKHFILSGGADGLVLVWNTYDNTNIITLGIQREFNIAHINDMTMLNKVGLLVTISSDKKINFWRYQDKELISSVPKSNYLLCLAEVESYGKLLFGTREKTITELDLVELFDELRINHNYVKLPFIQEEINYVEIQSDRGLNNFKIMKSILNKGIFDP